MISNKPETDQTPSDAILEVPSITPGKEKNKVAKRPTILTITKEDKILICTKRPKASNSKKLIRGKKTVSNTIRTKN
ncbi:MAG: hypothetical protein ACXWRG_11505 [Bdellovibrio sp.]